jgi:hypothetical protein
VDRDVLCELVDQTTFRVIVKRPDRCDDVAVADFLNREQRLQRSRFCAFVKNLSRFCGSRDELGLIRFRGHLPKGGYDVPNAREPERSAPTPAV